jgi:hypothetical protein
LFVQNFNNGSTSQLRSINNIWRKKRVESAGLEN